MLRSGKSGLPWMRVNEWMMMDGDGDGMGWNGNDGSELGELTMDGNGEVERSGVVTS